MTDPEQQLTIIYQRLVKFDEQSREEQLRSCKASGLTECQKRYLKTIDENEPLTSSEFAQLTCISKPTVSQLVTRFVGWNYIYKEHCPTDKRRCYIKLTDKGRRAVRLEQAAGDNLVRLIMTRLEDHEINELISLMNKLFKSKEEES